MMITREQKINRWALIAIGCFTVMALLVVSWDSYLYDLWQHHDVIWFYLCGKAWMNGMTPYVDFADSKGPLLWLIYGIGYLLSPHDYTGLYWLSCVLYTFIFYQCYKCARLFVRDTRLALVAVLLSAVFFLSGLTHIEVRAEDYCYALMLPLFYRFLRYNVGREQGHRFVKSTVLLLGFALGATFLIKYSCTLMLAVFIPYWCLVVPRRAGYSPWKALGWCALAGILTILPMIGWLAWKGCLDDFINEYFLNTFNTFDNMHGEEITIKQVLLMFLGKRVILFTLGVIASVVIYCKTIGKGWPGGGNHPAVVHGGDTAQWHRPHLPERAVAVHRAGRWHRHAGVVAVAALVGGHRCAGRGRAGAAVRHRGAQVTLCQAAA